MDLNRRSMDLDIVRFQLAQVNSGDDFAMHDQQQFISHQKIWQDWTLPLALNDLVERVSDRFQPLQALNFIHNGRLRGIDGQASASHDRSQMIPHASLRLVRKDGEADDAQ